MKKILLFFSVIGMLSACAGSSSNKNTNKEKCCDSEATVQKSCCSHADHVVLVTVDELYANPEKYGNKKVQVKGRVVHTCKRSGKKMFLAGSDENKLVKINAGEKISKFEETLEGELVLATGMLKVIETEADHEHENKEEGHTCTTDSKAKNFEMVCDSFEITE